MKKHIVRAATAVIMLLAVLALSGCRLEHYERSDIVSWAKENIADDVVVSRDYVEAMNSDGYIDRIWSAYLEREPDIPFTIVSHRYYGGESISHSIESTYRQTFGEFFFSDYRTHSDTDLAHEGSQQDFSRHYVTISFEDREGLAYAVQQVLDAEEFMNEAGAGDCLRYRIVYDDILSEVYRTDVEGYFTAENIDTALDSMTEEFALYAADYRLALDQFSPEELEKAVSSSGTGFIVRHNDGSQSAYSDLALSRFGHGMSFGTLFEVLNREGFDAYGTPYEFKFVARDGVEYRFSYFFNDLPYDSTDPDTGINYGYYYLRNGEQMPMDHYFYNHIDSGLLAEMTGMTFEPVS